MDTVSHATNDDGVKFMDTCDAAHVAPKTFAKILANRIPSVFRGEDDVEEDTHVGVAHMGPAF